MELEGFDAIRDAEAEAPDAVVFVDAEAENGALPLTLVHNERIFRRFLARHFQVKGFVTNLVIRHDEKMVKCALKSEENEDLCI